MRKYFGSALLSAALLSWTGASYADFTDEPISPSDIDVTSPSDIDVTSPSDVDVFTSPEAVNQAIADDLASDPVDCCECCGGWLDNTYVWLGGDVYKSLGERITNINGGTGALTNSFGGVAGFNTSFGLGESRIRGQFGASYGAYDPRGRLGIVPQQNTAEEQVYVTVGAYKRGDMVDDCDPISWGVVYDTFWADSWGVNANEIDLSQVRGVVGYALNACTEVGVWGTFDVSDDRAAVTVAGAPGVLSTIRAIDQINAYVKYNFEFGAQVTAYAGVVDNADIADWQFGVLGQAPLSCHWSLYSNLTYVSPSARSGPNGSGQEQFDVGFGLAYYFGGNASSPSVTGNKNLPLLNVANNGSFLVTD